MPTNMWTKTDESVMAHSIPSKQPSRMTNLQDRKNKNLGLCNNV